MYIHICVYTHVHKNLEKTVLVKHYEWIIRCFVEQIRKC